MQRTLAEGLCRIDVHGCIQVPFARDFVPWDQIAYSCYKLAFHNWTVFNVTKALGFPCSLEMSDVKLQDEVAPQLFKR